MPDLTDIRDRITRLTLAAGLPREVWSELCKIDSDLRAALTPSPPHVNAALATIGPLMTQAEAEQLRAERAAGRDAIAEAISEQLTASSEGASPDHVCPPPYGLGPDDLDMLTWLSGRPMPAHVRTVLDKILTAHRAPHS